MPSPSLTKISSIHTALRNEITGAKWHAGEKLPTDLELARRFGCSTGTINRAMTALAYEGFVERKTRVGTRVVRTTPSSQTTTTSIEAFAFIFPSERHEGMRRMMHGFQDAAQDGNRRILTLPTGRDFRKEAEIVGRLAEFDVKGAILFPVVTTPQDLVYYQQMILACPFPVVLVELNFPGLRRSAVVVDGFHAGYTMTRHLLDKGLRRVGFFGNYAWASAFRDRYLGYRKAMEEAGLAEDPALVRLDQEMSPNFDDPIRAPFEMASRYLQEAPDIQGVVCSVDYLAVGMIEAAREMGRRVPHDLLVAGIDDFSVAAEASVPITTYRIPYEEIGKRAFATLDAVVGGRVAPGHETQLRGEIVVRQSA